MANSLKSRARLVIENLGLYYFLERYRFNRFRNVKNEISSSFFFRNKKISSKNKTPIKNSCILIVVPSRYANKKTWQNSKGNIFFEIYKSASETFQNSSVKYFFVKSNLTNWKFELGEYVSRTEFDYIIMDAEIDPDGSGEWTLDSFLIENVFNWEGKFIWISMDSVLTTHKLRIDRISRIRPGSIVVAIDRKSNYGFRRSKELISPIFLPISNATIASIDKKFGKAPMRKFGLTFFGTVYGYRELELDNLLKMNINIITNPHKSSSKLPSYEDYLKQFIFFNSTLNFSRNSRHNINQLKSRILEAAIFGCFVVTDEDELWSKFFPLDSGIFYFSTRSELVAICNYLNSTDVNYNFREVYKKLARESVNKEFWRRISAATM